MIFDEWSKTTSCVCTYITVHVFYFFLRKNRQWNFHAKTAVQQQIRILTSPKCDVHRHGTVICDRNLVCFQTRKFRIDLCTDELTSRATSAPADAFPTNVFFRVESVRCRASTRRWRKTKISGSTAKTTSSDRIAHAPLSLVYQRLTSLPCARRPCLINYKNIIIYISPLDDILLMPIILPAHASAKDGCVFFFFCFSLLLLFYASLFLQHYTESFNRITQNSKSLPPKLCTRGNIKHSGTRTSNRSPRITRRIVHTEQRIFYFIKLIVGIQGVPYVRNRKSFEAISNIDNVRRFWNLIWSNTFYPLLPTAFVPQIINRLLLCTQFSPFLQLFVLIEHSVYLLVQRIYNAPTHGYCLLTHCTPSSQFACIGRFRDWWTWNS